MEVIQQSNAKLSIKTNTLKISIFDLGSHAEEMLVTWKKIKDQGKNVSLKEFPTIDIYQKIDNREIMEVVLEFLLLIESQKKAIAKERQAKGIAEAREKGIKLGRRPKKIPANFDDICQKIKNKEMTMTNAIQILQVDYKTFKKWTKVGK